MPKPHSTFRLSDETKDLLRRLAKGRDANLSATVTALIREEAARVGVKKPRRKRPEGEAR